MGRGSTTIQAPPAAPAPSAQESARSVLQAQLETNPAAARQAFELATSPEFGVKPFTEFLEQTRAEVLPQEAQVREQMLSNILGNLISPTGISTQQQEAIDLRRGQAQTELQRAIRERANLGGGLFGGRSQKAETEAVRDLQASFAEEDIARQERARLNAIQAALPALSVLFPELNIQAPQFVSPAPSGTAALQAQTAARGQDINAAIQAQAMRNQLQSSLFGGLGQAIGGIGSSAFGLGGVFGQKI